MGEVAEGERAEGSKESEMQQVEDALRSLCSGRESFRIPSGYQPPPRLQGKSCVYVLQLRRVGGDLSHELYVGEVNSPLAVPNLSHPIFPNLFISLLASSFHSISKFVASPSMPQFVSHTDFFFQCSSRMPWNGGS